MAANQTTTNLNALIAATTAKDFVVVHKLLANPSMLSALTTLDANSKAPINELLIWATRNGQLDIVQFCLKNGANINYHAKINRFIPSSTGAVYNYSPVADQTPLMVASAAGHSPIVKYLLQSNADYTYRTITFSLLKTTALDMAIKYGRTECGRLLYAKYAKARYGADPLTTLALSNEAQALRKNIEVSPPSYAELKTALNAAEYGKQDAIIIDILEDAIKQYYPQQQRSTPAKIIANIKRNSQLTAPIIFDSLFSNSVLRNMLAVASILGGVIGSIGGVIYAVSTGLFISDSLYALIASGALVTGGTLIATYTGMYFLGAAIGAAVGFVASGLVTGVTTVANALYKFAANTTKALYKGVRETTTSNILKPTESSIYPTPAPITPTASFEISAQDRLAIEKEAPGLLDVLAKHFITRSHLLENQLQVVRKNRNGEAEKDLMAAKNKFYSDLEDIKHHANLPAYFSRAVEQYCIDLEFELAGKKPTTTNNVYDFSKERTTKIFSTLDSSMQNTSLLEEVSTIHQKVAPMVKRFGNQI